MTPRFLNAFKGLCAFAALCLVCLAAPFAYAERYAAYAIEADTGEVLHEDMAREPRFPASLTKIMTLYMLFEALERGEVSLSERFPVSRLASQQPPSKIGVRRGESIRAEDAIRALVTKSANDVAVVIAERLAGTQAAFAVQMTAKARELGMDNTRFKNASGLPDPAQVTTAEDMAILSNALIDNFPQYYGYFQAEDFTYGRRTYPNHNRLLGKEEGVDGIKTGYIRASGFNLASSAVRGGRRVIVVVLGGETAAARDAQVSHLLNMAFETLAQRDSAIVRLPLPGQAPELPFQPIPPPETGEEENGEGEAAPETTALGASMAVVAMVPQGAARGAGGPEF